MRHPRVGTVDLVTPRAGLEDPVPALGAKPPRTLPAAIRERRKAGAPTRAKAPGIELGSGVGRTAGSLVCSFCINSVIDYQPRP